MTIYSLQQLCCHQHAWVLRKVGARQTRQIKLCKRKIEEVLKGYQIDDDKTRGEFIKKIRIDSSKDVSGAEITAFREHFQVPLALFGLSSNIYGCLKQFMQPHLRPLLRISQVTLSNC